jgi:phosphate transport system substrate-binding protein
MKRSAFLSLLPVIALGLSSCGKSDKEGGGDKTDAGVKTSGKVTIKTGGSTTIQPIMNEWADAYDDVKVSVAGGGSGNGIKELIAGRLDVANASRPMKPEEKADLKKATGKEVKEYHIGYDALAIFTAKNNPMKEISVEQLKEIYAAGGTITKWEQLGANANGMTGDIKVLGREASSGTGEYFQEAVCGKDAAGKKVEYRQGISEMSSSNQVIDTVATVATSIAYDGQAFKNDKVHWLAVSKKTGEPSVLPNDDDARTLKYPLARKLYLYTAGEPEPHVKKFIDWALSPEGQAILTKSHAVSLK